MLAGKRSSRSPPSSAKSNGCWGCCLPQAAEIGLGLGGLARHLINVALAHAGKQPLLPAAPGPDITSSVQWAQATGANDTVKEIQVELALQAVKEREDLETLEQRVSGTAAFDEQSPLWWKRWCRKAILASRVQTLEGWRWVGEEEAEGDSSP